MGEDNEDEAYNIMDNLKAAVANKWVLLPRLPYMLLVIDCVLISSAMLSAVSTTHPSLGCIREMLCTFCDGNVILHCALTQQTQLSLSPSAACAQEETVPLAHIGRNNTLPRVRGLTADATAYPKLGKAHADRAFL